jgi:hypothetical protein
VRSGGYVYIHEGQIKDNTAVNGGGIFAADYSDLHVGYKAVFNRNRASQARWIENDDPETIYINASFPREISMEDLIALHHSNIHISSFSASPTGEPGFTYIYNNYDVYVPGADETDTEGYEDYEENNYTVYYVDTRPDRLWYV